MIHTVKRRIFSLFLALSLLLGLTVPALADEGDPPAPIPAESVTLEPTDADLLLGKTLALTATLAPEGCSDTVTWTSNNAAVTAVDASGVVTGCGVGDATITALANGHEASCTVRVYDFSVSLDGSAWTAQKGSSTTSASAILSVNGSPASAPSLTWTSNDTSVFTVPENSGAAASLTGVAPGEATLTVTATASDGTERSAAGTVTVPGVAITQSGAVMSGKTITMVEGNAEQMSLRKVALDPATSFAWTSDAPGIARVDANGRVTAAAPSDTSAKISVKSGGGVYSDSFYVKVVSNEAKLIKPASLKAGTVLSFKTIASDFSERCRQMLKTTENPSPTLSYITNLSVPADAGTLYYSYVSRDDPGMGVGTLEKYYYAPSGSSYVALKRVTFVPQEGFSGTAVISYNGYDTAGNRFVGKVNVKVEEAEGVVYNTTKGMPLAMVSEDFNEICSLTHGRALSYVRFKLPSASCGTLYYNYVNAEQYEYKVGVSDTFYRTRIPSLDNVFFVPASGFSGEAEIAYTACDSSGYTYDGEITVYVEGEADAGVITYTTDSASPVTLAVSDFNEACRRSFGNSLRYVRFTSLPSASSGTLYYNYASSSSYGSKVSTSSSYYRSGSPQLSMVTFVPKTGYFGTVEQPFIAYDINGNSFRGTVNFVVTEKTNNITYYVDEGETAAFSVSDFNMVCRELTGDNVNYVRFSLPSSSYGTLYYNYNASAGSGTPVGGATYFYRNSTPSISSVVFVPKNNYVGTLTVSYTGGSLSGDTYNGTVEIVVAGSNGDISYSTAAGAAVKFASSDFDDVVYDLRGTHLNYVQFELPSASCGTLYLNYSASSSSRTKVTSGNKYYRYSYPSVSSISFVPESNYIGTVAFDYTAYDSNGFSFRGTVTVTVGSALRNTVSYSTTSGVPVSFSSYDFDSICTAATGYNLRYVRFTLPSASCGTLYYNYTSSSSPGSKVTNYSNYYRSGSPELSKVTFVPASGYSGTVNIACTAYDQSGNQVSCTVTITVGSAAQGVHYTVYYNKPATFDAADFNAVCQALMGSKLDYVQFTLPSTSRGILYYGYEGVNNYGTKVTAAQRYYRASSPQLSRVTFLPAAGFTGTASIGYTAYAVSGKSFGGNVEITVLGSSHPFTDMGRYSWAEDAVAYLYAEGVVSGRSATTYGPGENISRADFALMLYRAYGFSKQSAEAFADVPASAYYADAVHTLRAKGVVVGDGGGFNPHRELTRQDAMVMMLRAMRASGWFEADGTRSELAVFSDANAVSDYAVSAVGAMVRMGVIEGSNMRLNPKNALTRAEMAVILYRALK